MQIIRVCLEYQQDDGRMTTRTLAGIDAKQWDDWIKQVCLQAYTRNRNPSWSSLNWQENAHRIVAASEGKTDSQAEVPKPSG